MKNLMVTIPHSGEKVPDGCPWLAQLPEPVLMCDVDRYVDRLYAAMLKKHQIDFVKTQWHRYAGDLNRLDTDIDAGTVEGSAEPQGKYDRGFHWRITTTEKVLQPKPMSQKMHQELVDLIYKPFHEQVQALAAQKKRASPSGVLHLDLHSMPGLGTTQHRDPGERRADIVVSDCLGKSADRARVDLVMLSFVRAGFKVGYNWPYMGGRLSEVYGKPEQGHHTVQVEINRSLYMDEVTKQWRPELAPLLEKKLETAMASIVSGLDQL